MLIYDQSSDGNTNKRGNALPAPRLLHLQLAYELSKFCVAALAIYICWATLLQGLTTKGGHTMNVSSRTVVILNILSAAGLVMLLASKFNWF